MYVCIYLYIYIYAICNMYVCMYVCMYDNSTSFSNIVLKIRMISQCLSK